MGTNSHALENRLWDILMDNMSWPPLTAQSVTDNWIGVHKPYPMKIRHLADALRDGGVRYFSEMTTNGPRYLYALATPSILPYVKQIEADLEFYRTICEGFQGRILAMEQRMEELTNDGRVKYD